MSFKGGDTPVGDQETLARYVLSRRWIRNSDQTPRPDAFMPYPHSQLSVNRHNGSMEKEVWNIGQSVAKDRSRTLYGRADFGASLIKKIEGLFVEPHPLQHNPNHANVKGWSADKDAQKSKAQEIAAIAHFVSVP